MKNNNYYDKSEMACYVSDGSAMTEDDPNKPYYHNAAARSQINKQTDFIKNEQNENAANLDFEQALFQFGQDPNDPYEHKQSETKLTSTQDGYEELFVRDNIDQIPSSLDNLAESEM